jgi:hypothetical protein
MDAKVSNNHRAEDEFILLNLAEARIWTDKGYEFRITLL